MDDTIIKEATPIDNPMILNIVEKDIKLNLLCEIKCFLAIREIICTIIQIAEQEII